VSDTRELLERVGDGFDFPPDAFDRLEYRRDRRQRNRRLQAGAVGLAVAIAVAWLGISAIRWTGAVPADNPTETPTVREDPTQGSVRPHRFFGGTVTFAAANPPWSLSHLDGNTILFGTGYQGIHFLVDPQPVGAGCEVDPAAADAASMAARVGGDPDIRASDPIPVRISGTDGVQMDVAGADGASQCVQLGEPGLFKVAGTPSGDWGAYLGLNSRWRYRLYLLDVPGSSQIVAILVFAHDRQFDAVMQAATPVLDSIHLRSG
jgi:hypothetical protein